MSNPKTITVDELTDVLADATASTPEEIEQGAEELEIAPPHEDEGWAERHAQPLTADDVPMLRREIANELENWMTRR